MKDGQAFIICAEMKHHPYNLRGSSLEVFSALYSLTKKRAFLGSYEDLAGWLEIDLKTLKRAISKLQEKGIVYVEQKSYARYEFQAFHIKGYPLPDYKYCGKRSTTKAPVIDTQNIEEYREEIAAFEKQQVVGQNDQVVGQNDQVVGQNDQVVGQNDQVSKEKNQKKNNYNIYNNNKKSNTFYLGKAVLSKNKDGVYKDEIYPPTWEMVKEYAEKHVPTISLDVAKRWFAYAASGDWEMSHGRKIKNWHASLYWFDQNHTDIEKEKSARRVTQAQMGVPQEVLDMEERMRENRRREREQHEIEANTPEAKAAAERVLSKFCKN